VLNAGTRPFDFVNYLGSALGGSCLTTRRMGIMFDRVVAALHRRLDAETDANLARGMHCPTRWEPFFQCFMTLADMYRFPTSTSSSTVVSSRSDRIQQPGRLTVSARRSMRTVSCQVPFSWAMRSRMPTVR